MRTGQDGERGETFGMAIRHAPRHLSAPVVTDEVEALAGGTRGIGDVDRVGDELVEEVVVEIRRVRPRARRVAALVGSDGAVACLGELRQCSAPTMPRFGKAV